ncbi:MAG: hypothetical protein IJU32_02860 [Pyramidobacter sp.]|nr:hypothetical protein [Pyramidobacter sp.]MBQ9422499.1 hypothetical protein [Pyramidobacter sp.]
MKKLVSLVAICAVLAVSSAALAADYPTRAITMTTSRAGSQIDFAARVFAKIAHKYLGENIIISNTAGVVDASRSITGAAPDGYTLCWNNNSIFISDVMGRTDFDSVEGFETVCVPGEKRGTWIAIKKDLADEAGIHTLKDLWEYSRKHPGDLVAGDTPGAVAHVEVLELIEAGFDFTSAAVGDANKRLTNFLGGNIDVFLGAYSLIDQYVKRGDVVCLASMGKERSKYTPDIPCTAEFGYNTDAVVFYTITAPKGTPKDVLEKLSDVCKKVAADPEYTEALAKNMIDATYYDLEGSRKYVADYKKMLVDIGMATK